MKPTYTQRNVLLIQLGYSSYAEYLATELWIGIRAAVFKRDEHRCKLCGKDANVIHHVNYEETTLLGVTLDGMVSVCHDCHKKVEFDSKNKKRTLVQAIMVYQALLAKRLRKINNIPKNKYGRPRSGKPQCECGNFRRHNRLKCRACEPDGKIQVYRGNRHLFNK